jgi:adenosylcobyric acid synthase
VESGKKTADGLGLLPVKTVLEPEKVTQAVAARTLAGVEFQAYEIHMGRTTATAPVGPLCEVNGRPEGARAGNRLGTYLNGALENPDVVREWLGVEPGPAVAKEDSYDRLAEWFEQAADTALFERLYLSS